MEFLQVPETPAPEPVEMLEMQEDCQEAQIGMSPDKCFVFAFNLISIIHRLNPVVIQCGTDNGDFVSKDDKTSSEHNNRASEFFVHHLAYGSFILL